MARKRVGMCVFSKAFLERVKHGETYNAQVDKGPNIDKYQKKSSSESQVSLGSNPRYPNTS